MSIARFIDATLLKPEAGEREIRQLCTRAHELGCYAVCVNPVWVETAAGCLKGTGVKVCTVVGFPLGALMTRQKLLELGNSMQAGAEELDMVVNLGWLKSGSFSLVAAEIEQACGLAHQGQALLKVIIETGMLNEEEIRIISRIAADAGADFVKTCTGYGPRGVTVDDIKIIREAVGTSVRIKASGGIRTLDFARQLVAAGADRLGISGFEAVLKEELGG